jgi:hypothetical protein
MTAEDAVPRNRAGSYALQAALAALIVGVLAAFGGWLYTVRELNRLAAYHVVGAEALRLAHSAHAKPEPVPAIYAGKWE